MPVLDSQGFALHDCLTKEVGRQMDRAADLRNRADAIDMAADAMGTRVVDWFIWRRDEEAQRLYMDRLCAAAFSTSRTADDAFDQETRQLFKHFAKDVFGRHMKPRLDIGEYSAAGALLLLNIASDLLEPKPTSLTVYAWSLVGGLAWGALHAPLRYLIRKGYGRANATVLRQGFRSALEDLSGVKLEETPSAVARSVAHLIAWAKDEPARARALPQSLLWNMDVTKRLWASTVNETEAACPVRSFRSFVTSWRGLPQPEIA